MKEMIIKKKQFSDKCNICKKIVNGNSKEQVIFNLKYHIERKHKQSNVLKGGKDTK